MKQIVLDSVCIENFRSFTESTVIEFSRSSGLKFISGANQVEPELGANGAGKSTVWDAICYALYGESIKGLKASELKSYGARSTTALVMLQIDSEVHWVQRTSPPERITIDDRLATQKEVDRLVGLSRDRFLNSVVFGQAVPLFIDLTKPQRGDLLDEVLNLEMWIKAAHKATERHTQQSLALTELRRQGDRLEGQLTALPNVGELRSLENAWQIERDERLRVLIERYEKVEEEIKQLEEQITQPVDQQSVTKAKAAFDNATAIKTEIRDAQTRFWTKLQRIEQDITFFNQHDTCPTCGQDITQEFCNEHLAALEADQQRYNAHITDTNDKLSEATATANDLGNAWQQAIQNVGAAQRHQAVIAEQLRAKREQSTDLQQQAVRTRNEKNPYKEQRKAATAERKRISIELGKQRETEEEAAKGLNITNYWRQGFRRVREYCLGNVLRELTLDTHNQLLALGLHRWNVSFVSQEPTQRGTTRFGVEVHIEPPAKPSGSFDVLSGGEGQRVRLAVSLGLASLVQRWAGVKWSFEMFDEPTAWLSEQGVEDLLDCLSYRATAQDKSVFICDHRALSHSGFAENYLVSKDTDGSHWQRV